MSSRKIVLQRSTLELTALCCAEATLRTLKKQQRDKVEELKRKTGYYSTKSLLDKYDDVIKKKVCTSSLNLPCRCTSLTPVACDEQEEARNPPSTPIKKGSQPGPPVGPGGIPFPSTPNRSGAASVPPPGTPQQHLPLLPPAPSTPAPRTLVDKLADALLGVSAEEGTPNSKYALICGECFSHNGLMVKEEWDTIRGSHIALGALSLARNGVLMCSRRVPMSSLWILQRT